MEYGFPYTTQEAYAISNTWESQSSWFVAWSSRTMAIAGIWAMTSSWKLPGSVTFHVKSISKPKL